MNKNILITGSSGFIGNYLANKFSREGFNVIGIDIRNSSDKLYKEEKFNIKNIKKLEQVFKNNSIDIVIHCSANKSVPWCEKNPNQAKKNNFSNTITISNFCQKYSSKLIFISSDIVFSGKKGNYSINDYRRPINVYGKLKRDAENILKNRNNTVICRTALVFGKIPKEQKEEKYLNSEKLVVQGFIVEQVIYRLENSKNIILPEDEFCSPTSTFQLFLQIKEIIKKDIKSGIFHLSGSEKISRYEFGIKIAKMFHLNENLILKGIHEDVLRPVDVSLNIQESERKLNLKFMNIDQMLSNIKEELEL